jgi:mycothiol synthase
VTRPPRTTRLSAIDDATASEIRALLALAEDADGVEAVSESFRLAIGPAREGVVHLVRLDEDDAVVGYAQVAQAGGPDAVAELVVDPRHRRRGHGRALLDEVVALGARSVWAHGMLPAATALAAAAGLVVTRELYVMGRPLTAEDAVDPALPQGFSVRPFEPGVDDEHWVALNAAAFASHPEQGRLTLTDLHERMAQPWFDPAGLLLVVDDTTERRGRLPLDQGRARHPARRPTGRGVRRRGRSGVPGPRARGAGDLARPGPPRAPGPGRGRALRRRRQHRGPSDVHAAGIPGHRGPRPVRHPARHPLC